MHASLAVHPGVTSYYCFHLLQELRKSLKHKVMLRCCAIRQSCFSFNLLFHIPLPLTAGVDFSTDGFPVQVTIPAGETDVQFSVKLMNELIVERDEQFQVSFTYSGGQPGVIVRPGFDKANITIKNDDG